MKAEFLISQKILPLFYHDDVEWCGAVLRTLSEGGIQILEFTNRGAQALDNFAALKKIRDEELPDFKLGIGTIKSIADAEKFLAAGADFFISPGFSVGLASWMKEREQLWIPGCMTPSEIMAAEDSGISLVKIFPGNIVGPGFVKAIRPVFPQMRFVITGGVSLESENLKSWFDAGASCVGLGSNLFTPALTEARDADALRESARSLVAQTSDL